MDYLDSPSKGQVQVGFTLFAIVASGLAVLFAGGNPMELVIAYILGIFAAIITVGFYLWGRSEDIPHSHAVAGSAIVLGVLYIVGLILRLLIQWPSPNNPLPL